TWHPRSLQQPSGTIMESAGIYAAHAIDCSPDQRIPRHGIPVFPDWFVHAGTDRLQRRRVVWLRHNPVCARGADSLQRAVVLLVRTQTCVAANPHCGLGQDRLLSSRAELRLELRVLTELEAAITEPRILRGIKQEHQHPRLSHVLGNWRSSRVLAGVEGFAGVVVHANDPAALSSVR